MYSIIDFAGIATPKRLQACKKAGIKTVGLYVRNLTKLQLTNARKAGMRLFVIEEHSGGQHHELSATLGVSHAKEAVAKCKAVGVPDGACIYAACDTDPTPAAYVKKVVAYFESFNRTLKQISRYHSGCYGPGKICAATLDVHVDKAWLANAKGWSGYKAFLASKRWVLLQHLPQTIGGIKVDPNEANGDFGDFAP